MFVEFLRSQYGVLAESIWSPFGVLNGLMQESHGIKMYLFQEFTRIPQGVHVHSTWSPYGPMENGI